MRVLISFQFFLMLDGILCIDVLLDACSLFLLLSESNFGLPSKSLLFLLNFSLRLFSNGHSSGDSGVGRLVLNGRLGLNSLDLSLLPPVSEFTLDTIIVLVPDVIAEALLSEAWLGIETECTIVAIDNA